jgi:hypothetical protein
MSESLGLPGTTPQTKNKNQSQALLAHTCNPSYSGGRDQENHSLKPEQESSSPDPISKKKNKKGVVEWLK